MSLPCGHAEAYGFGSYCVICDLAKRNAEVTLLKRILFGLVVLVVWAISLYMTFGCMR